MYLLLVLGVLADVGGYFWCVCEMCSEVELVQCVIGWILGCELLGKGDLILVGVDVFDC